jgi:GAF domain-containing protein
MRKAAQYRHVQQHLQSLIHDEPDVIAVMSTVACELFHAFDTFDWVGFYRVVAPGLLKVGPYQGAHGCLTIPFERGVCGKCAREGAPQVVEDVATLPYYIACSHKAQSEIVVPVFDRSGTVCAVLDVDSNQPGAFDTTDQKYLEAIAERLRHMTWPGG